MSDTENNAVRATDSVEAGAEAVVTGVEPAEQTEFPSQDETPAVKDDAEMASQDETPAAEAEARGDDDAKAATAEKVATDFVKEVPSTTGETNEAASAAGETEEAASAETEDIPAEHNQADAGRADIAKEPTSTEQNKTHEAENDAADGKDASSPTSTVNGQKKRKFNPTTEAETDDPVKIRAQVEFYFGDSNLPVDKFLWEKSGGSENKPVPISVITSFKRMRHFQPYSAVVAALRNSTFLVVGGADGKETVRRKWPYRPNQDRRAFDARTVYVKGFGDEQDGTQAELEQFFRQFAKIASVRLRREQDGTNKFKGSVYVQFETAEAADAFVARDPKPTHHGRELLVKSKVDYCKEKTEQIRNGEMQPSMRNTTTRFFEGRESKPRGGGHRGSAEHQNYKGDRSDWKKRRDFDTKNKKNVGGRGGFRGGRGNRGNNGSRKYTAGDKETPGDDSVQNGKTEVATETNGKRAREEDQTASSGEPPVKKIDTKEAIAA